MYQSTTLIRDMSIIQKPHYPFNGPLPVRPRSHRPRISHPRHKNTSLTSRPNPSATSHTRSPQWKCGLRLPTSPPRPRLCDPASLRSRVRPYLCLSGQALPRAPPRTTSFFHRSAYHPILMLDETRPTTSSSMPCCDASWYQGHMPSQANNDPCDF